MTAAIDDFAVFPVARDKRPLGRWKDESRPRHEWNGVWPEGANVGIDCGKSGLVVIDEDKEGTVASWLGELPSTYTVRTGRGRHLYFRAPSGQQIGNRIAIVEGVDVRAEGGYVVGAGSIHANGTPYAVEVDAPIADLPPAVLTALTSHSTKTSRDAVLRLDLSDYRERFQLPEVIGEGERQDTLFRYACSLVARRQRDEEAVVLLGTAYDRCSPPWTNREDGYETPEALWARAKGTYAGDAESDHEHFWQARPILGAMRDFARDRQVSPWAMFGAVLAHASASISPNVVLPPERGAVASLNLFVALCGSSGSGKSAVLSAALDFLQPEGGEEYLQTGAGSGEGLLGAYGYMPKPTTRKPAPEFRRTRVSVLFVQDEIRTLAALLSRSGSTLTGTLNSAWTGASLATQNATAERTRHVEAHRYRFTLVVGVQPENASPILDEQASGLPQRWLWLPTYDPGLGTEPERRPQPQRWGVPDQPSSVDPDTGTITFPPERQLPIPEPAREAIRAAALAANTPIGAPTEIDALDGHAVLNRLKVAALLAQLDQRNKVTDDDWSLSGVVMRVSDDTRQRVEQAVRSSEERADAGHAIRQGRSTAIAREEEHSSAVRRAQERVLNWLTPDRGQVAVGSMKRSITKSSKEYVEEAVDLLVEAGLLKDHGDAAGVNGKTARYVSRG